MWSKAVLVTDSAKEERMKKSEALKRDCNQQRTYSRDVTNRNDRPTKHHSSTMPAVAFMDMVNLSQRRKKEKKERQRKRALPPQATNSCDSKVAIEKKIYLFQ